MRLLLAALMMLLPMFAHAADTMRRKQFYRTTDFGALVWLHRAKSRENANLQSFVTNIGAKPEVCIDDIRDVYWLQLNHRAPSRDGLADAFVVSILYKGNTADEVALQLYRNRNWVSMDSDDQGLQSRKLLAFRRQPGELPDVDKSQFIDLHSASFQNAEQRLATLHSSIGEFHARVDQTTQLSSWHKRGQFSGVVKTVMDQSVFRYAARLYRFKTTAKSNSNVPVVVELKRHGAEKVDILIQSLSSEVREGTK